MLIKAIKGIQIDLSHSLFILNLVYLKLIDSILFGCLNLWISLFHNIIVSISNTFNNHLTGIEFISIQTFCCHINKWFVLSSRPATSFDSVDRKSSNPSPPEIIRTCVDSLSVELFAGCFLFGRISFVSREVRKRTCPVCPWGIPNFTVTHKSH